MGLIVHAGNDLDRLGDRLIADLARDLLVADPADLFSDQLILVPTAGLRDWLRQRIADRLGICTGIRFCFPAQLLGELRRLTGLAVPEPAWDLDRARWTCLRLLDGVADLAPYLADDHGRRRAFGLATALVDTFARYALYRPEATLEPWVAGKAGPHDQFAPWQADLWRSLRDAGAGDPLAEHRAVVTALASGRGDLPERVHGFGFNTLAPHLLRLLAALGERVEVVLHTLQPTYGYWGDDQRPRRELLRQDVPVDDWGNRLLGDWGTVGRTFLAALDGVGADYRAGPEDFRDPGDGCLLHRIQADIVAARAPGEAGPFALQPDDASLRIHACFGLRRQLEVVKAAIHEACAADPGLQVHDIALMCPDPAAVAPLAQAVFAGSGSGPRIDVAVADRTARLVNPAADVLLRLIDLIAGRFTAGEVVDFVGCAAVAAAWGLGADELDRLREWIDRADLRWGVDARHRAETVGHAYAAGSWIRGLQRLHLAWWFGPDADRAEPFATGDDPAEAVVPVDGFEPEEFDVLKRVSNLLGPILATAEQARGGHDAGWWQERLTALLQTVLRVSDEDADLAEVVARLAAWRSVVDASGWSGDLGADLLAADFAERFSIASGGDFGRGALTICGMQPMRSVPFRMLCLVGMDDGAFPREARRRDFDLLDRAPRPGDRDLRQEDRYLMLELLLSASDRLCIAYQGFDARDRSVLAPATLVGELIETIAETCATDAAGLTSHGVLNDHALHLSQDDQPVWPAPLVAAEHAALAGTRQPAAFHPEPLPSTETTIDLDSLIAFWRQPARAYLQRLGVDLAKQREPPRDHERFADLRALDRHGAARRILEATVPDDVLHDRLAAEGWLPPAALGATAWHRLLAFVGDLREHGRHLATASRTETLRATYAGSVVTGTLPLVHPQAGVVVIHPGKESPGRLLDLAIRAALAGASGLEPLATLVTVDDGSVRTRTLRLPAAPSFLDHLLNGFHAGQRSVIPFAVTTSSVYAERRWGDKAEDHPAALGEARSRWSAADFGSDKSAESDEPAHRLVWPEPSTPCDHPDFAGWAEHIWRPVLEALSKRVKA